jgi:hypothetical protein
VPSLGPAAAVRPGPPPTPLNEAAVGGDRLASGEAGGGVLESYPNEHGGDVAGEKWKHSTANVAGGHLRVVHHSCCTHVDTPSSPADPGRPFGPQNSRVEAKPSKIQGPIQDPFFGQNPVN